MEVVHLNQKQLAARWISLGHGYDITGTEQSATSAFILTPST